MFHSLTNNATNWRPSVQTHKPMSDISHTNSARILPLSSKVCDHLIIQNAFVPIFKVPTVFNCTSKSLILSETQSSLMIMNAYIKNPRSYMFPTYNATTAIPFQKGGTGTEKGVYQTKVRLKLSLENTKPCTSMSGIQDF